MKSFLKIFYYLVVLSLLIGCELNNTNKHLDTINLTNPIKNLTPLQISEYATDIKYIQLAGGDEKLKTIYKIAFSERYIAVADNKICLLYDSDGNFISKIGTAGKGPGQYINISNVLLGMGKEVFIQSGKRILSYNYSGNFMREFNPLIHSKIHTICSLSIHQDSLFIGQIPNYSGMEEYNAVVFNNKGETLRLLKNTIHLDRKTVSFNSFDSHATFFHLKEKLFFKEKMNDTLFMFQDWEIIPTIAFNLGNFSQPKSERELNPLEMAKNIDDYIFIDDVYETSSYIFVDCAFNNHSTAKRSKPKIIFGVEDWFYTRKVLGIYDKKLKILKFSEPEKTDNAILKTGLYNNFDGGPKFYPKTMVNDSTLAMWFDAYLLKEHVASQIFKKSKPIYPEKKKELEELANSLNENDNPVLVLVKLKE